MKYGDLYYYPSQEALDQLLVAAALLGGPGDDDSFWLHARPRSKAGPPDNERFVPRKLNKGKRSKELIAMCHAELDEASGKIQQEIESDSAL